jgi:large subunit ribosomal protein L14e
MALSHVILTSIVIDKLPRGARTGTVAKAWSKAKVEEKFRQGSWAKKQDQKERKRGLTDFGRFKVMKMRKSVSGNVLRPATYG